MKRYIAIEKPSGRVILARGKDTAEARRWIRVALHDGESVEVVLHEIPARVPEAVKAMYLPTAKE